MQETTKYNSAGKKTYTKLRTQTSRNLSPGMGGYGRVWEGMGGYGRVWEGMGGYGRGGRESTRQNNTLYLKNSEIIGQIYQFLLCK